VLLQRVAELAHGGREGFLVRVRQAGAGGRDRDSLETLAAHDRAQTATAGEPVRVVVRIREGDAGCLEAHLAGRAVGDRRDLRFALHGVHLRGGVVVAEALEVVGAHERAVAGLVDVEHVDGARVGRLALDDDRSEPELRERVRHLTAGVRFLDSAGQRALRPDRDAPAVGGRRPAEKARREDELVLGAECVRLRRDLVEDDRVGQGASHELRILGGDRFLLHGQVGHVDAHDVSHRHSLPHVGTRNLPLPKRASELYVPQRRVNPPRTRTPARARVRYHRPHIGGRGLYDGARRHPSEGRT
jgi:hypothetical protein